MSLETLKLYAQKFLKEHPELEEEIKDYYQLALDEIEQGSSVDQEINSFVQGVEDLIYDHYEV